MIFPGVSRVYFLINSNKLCFVFPEPDGLNSKWRTVGKKLLFAKDCQKSVQKRSNDRHWISVWTNSCYMYLADVWKDAYIVYDLPGQKYVKVYCRNENEVNEKSMSDPVWDLKTKK